MRKGIYFQNHILNLLSSQSHDSWMENASHDHLKIHLLVTYDASLHVNTESLAHTKTKHAYFPNQFLNLLSSKNHDSWKVNVSRVRLKIHLFATYDSDLHAINSESPVHTKTMYAYSETPVYFQNHILNQLSLKIHD